MRLYRRGFRNGWGNRPCADTPRCVCLRVPRGHAWRHVGSHAGSHARQAGAQHGVRRAATRTSPPAMHNNGTSGRSGHGRGAHDGRPSTESQSESPVACRAGEVESCWPTMAESRLVVPIRPAAFGAFTRATAIALASYTKGTGYILRGPPNATGPGAWPPPLLADRNGKVRVLDLTDAVKCACPAPPNATIRYREDRLWPITTSGNRMGKILAFKCKRAARLERLEESCL